VPIAHEYWVALNAPAVQKYPPLHAPEGALSPGVAQYDPGVHECCVADDEPDGQKNPTSHGPPRDSTKVPAFGQ
jgi:hypothetical protein